MKVFNTGIIVGRFQHIHKGHEKIINIGLSLCDKLILFIGSSQERNTVRNPYDYVYREKLVNKVFKDEIESGRIIIEELEDITNESDLTPEWGKYVLRKAEEVIGARAECIIYGKDKDIKKCFSDEDMSNITEVLVDRKTMDISATMIRKFIVDDDKEQWKCNVNEKIYDDYDELRSMLLKIYKDVK